MTKTNNFILIVLAFLVLSAIANAQSIVQSRFINTTTNECATCDVPSDGILHIRFQPAGSQIVGGNSVKFVIQMRKRGSSTRYLNQASFLISYNNQAFGDNLNDPPLFTGENRVRFQQGTANPDAQCTVSEGDLFNPPPPSRGYRHFWSDNDPINLNELSLFGPNRDFQADDAAINRFSVLSESWMDLLEITCTIPPGASNADAGIAINGEAPASSWIRAFPPDFDPDDDFSAARAAFMIADNDIRGFRLDGKTWAKDYARYGNGEGVRLEFSKGIRDALAIGNFTLDSTGDSSLISAVNHTRNSSIVEIEFSQAIANDVLRLSTDTSVVDVEDQELADGNFLAQLFYDADAPEVTGIRRDSAFTADMPNQSRWFLDFSSALTTPTAAGLCVTEDNGLCVAEDGDEDPTVDIVRVDVVTTSTIAIVTQGMSATNRSIEFRRNRVLGTDYKVVEDYQPELRGVLPESVPPTISVRWVDINGDPIDNPRSAELDPPATAAGTYTMYFRVTASEPVTDLGIAAAYGVSTIADLENPTLVDNAATITVLPGASTTRTILEVTSEAASQVSDGGIEAFTLRALANFQDRVGNAAVRRDGSPIAVNAAIDLRNNVATAKRDDDSPILTQEPSSLDLTGSEYSLIFNISANEDVPTLSDAGSYQLVVENRDDVVVDPSAFTVASSDASGSSTQAVITYTVRFSDVAAASTAAAFILNRTAGQLLDRSFNQPINDEGHSNS